MSVRILVGDVRTRFAEIQTGSVHCVVTSPPYWGLRDYGVDGQLGLESTPAGYVESMVAVFREVRRVLHRTGTLWLNMGDCYIDAGGAGAQGVRGERAKRRHTQRSLGMKRVTRAGLDGAGRNQEAALRADEAGRVCPELRYKSLVGMPWRLALALQEDGWILRADIVWAKPNPMPESVRDRPTRAHEYVFLLAKDRRYFFDQEAVREPISPRSIERARRRRGSGKYEGHHPDEHGRLRHGVGYGPGGRNESVAPPHGRNLRSVWTIPTSPYKGAHFATFPARLVEPCIRAGTSEQGACSICAAPWERVVERAAPRGDWHGVGGSELKRGHVNRMPRGLSGDTFLIEYQAPRATGWRSSCDCALGAPVPCTVLDPFAGAGTTLLVADRLGRSGVGIELNPKYAALAERRLQEDAVRRSAKGVPA